MELRIGTAQFEHEHREPFTPATESTPATGRGLVWRFKVRPVLNRESLQAAKMVGAGGSGENSGVTVALWLREVAGRAAVALLAVDAPDGKPVTINGLAPTDAAVLPLVLDADHAIADSIAHAALKAGALVEDERKNSLPAPG